MCLTRTPFSHSSKTSRVNRSSPKLIERAATDVTLYLSIINFGEIAYITERETGAHKSAEILADVRRLPLVLCEAAEPRVLAAAHIKAQHAVSYADAFAIALAQEMKATLVTGDPEILAVSEIIPLLPLQSA
jgi:ribonuclease VapC